MFLKAYGGPGTVATLMIFLCWNRYQGLNTEARETWTHHFTHSVIHFIHSCIQHIFTRYHPRSEHCVENQPWDSRHINHPPQVPASAARWEQQHPPHSLGRLVKEGTAPDSPWWMTDSVSSFMKFTCHHGRHKLIFCIVCHVNITKELYRSVISCLSLGKVVHLSRYCLFHLFTEWFKSAHLCEVIAGFQNYVVLHSFISGTQSACSLPPTPTGSIILFQVEIFPKKVSSVCFRFSPSILLLQPSAHTPPYPM